MLVREKDIPFYINELYHEKDHKYIWKEYKNGKWRYHYDPDPDETNDVKKAQLEEGIAKGIYDASVLGDNIVNGGRESENTYKNKQVYESKKMTSFWKTTIYDLKNGFGSAIASGMEFLDNLFPKRHN